METDETPAPESTEPSDNDVSACITDLPLIKADLADIIDVPRIQSIIDDLYRITHIGMAITDLDDNILVGVGWQDICLKFHRVNEKTRTNCLESDRFLTKNVEEGKCRSYKCRNNMWEIVTPIFVGGEHKGNLFIGQFFYDDETPDFGLFIQQAERYGFDKGDYLAALSKVPRLNHERVKDMMEFNVKLTSLISQLGYSNLKLIKENAERIKIEQAFREKEQIIDRILSADPNGILIFNIADGQVVYQNSRGIELFGLPPEELRSLRDAIRRRGHPEDIWKFEKAVAEMPILMDYETNEIEVRLRNRVDDWIWAHLYLVPFRRDENGGLAQVLIVMEEVTERISAEKEMALQLEEIFRTNESLTEITRELRRSETELRKANDKMNILNTITRHDSMNQLAVIKGFVSLLEMTELTPKQAEHVNKMGKSVDAIWEQLEFVKIYQDIGVKTPTWQNLSDCVRDARQMLTLNGMRIVEKDLGFWILADPMFSKVVYNLVENALRHSGGADLMSITTEEQGDTLTIAFEDNGSGISPEDKVHLFQQGFGKHTGLGLFLIREILKITDIQISETGEAGKGARFELSVPTGHWCSQ